MSALDAIPMARAADAVCWYANTVPSALQPALEHCSSGSAKENLQHQRCEREVSADQDLLGRRDGFVMVTTRGLRMAWHVESQSVAKPRGPATRLGQPSVSVCKPRGSRDDATWLK